MSQSTTSADVRAEMYDKWGGAESQEDTKESGSTRDAAGPPANPDDWWSRAAIPLVPGNSPLVERMVAEETVGAKDYRLTLKLDGFNREDLKIKTAGRTLMVRARKVNLGGINRDLKFATQLPEDIIKDDLEAQWNGRTNTITISAPRHA